MATKATKPADDSGDDDNEDDKEDVPSISKKGNDGVDDKQGVKEGGVLAAAKAAKPDGVDSEDDKGKMVSKCMSRGLRGARSVS